MAKLFDRVKVATTTFSDAATITLGSAETGFQTFAQAGAVNGDSVAYAIEDGSSNWEIGVGTYNSTGPTLTRTVTQSSVGGTTRITLSAASRIISTLTRAEMDVRLPIHKGTTAPSDTTMLWLDTN